MCFSPVSYAPSDTWKFIQCGRPDSPLNWAVGAVQIVNHGSWTGGGFTLTNVMDVGAADRRGKLNIAGNVPHGYTYNVAITCHNAITRWVTVNRA
jgi:hypothetical protein